MKQPAGRYLSKREQQIMEIVYRQGEVTASELTSLLPGTPSNSTVRTLLRILEERGELRHEERDGRFVYSACKSEQVAARSELTKVVDTFFKGSVLRTVSALLQEKDLTLTPEELGELERMIAEAKKEER